MNQIKLGRTTLRERINDDYQLENKLHIWFYEWSKDKVLMIVSIMNLKNIFESFQSLRFLSMLQKFQTVQSRALLTFCQNVEILVIKEIHYFKEGQVYS